MAAATAFVFPGLDGVQRAIDFRPLLARPGFVDRWRIATAAFEHVPGFAAFTAALRGGEARVLPLVEDWRWPALAVAAMQLAVAEELTVSGVHADLVVGYSIGEVARSLHVGVASFEDLVAFTRAFGPAPRGAGTTVIAFAPHSSALAAALAELGPAGAFASRLSHRIIAVPTAAEHEAAVRRTLARHGLRLFELAPCALHGPMQRPFARRLQRQLDRAPLRPLRVPVFSSQSLRPIRDLRELRRELAANVAAPFDFAAAIRTLHREHGVDRFVNIGPGRHAAHFLQHSGLDVEVRNATELLAPIARSA